MDNKLIKNFYKKKIIFFSVQTFNYERFIAEKLRSYGSEVIYYDERPNNSNFTKGIIRLKRSLYQRKIDAYYNEILKKTAYVQFDYLLVIRGEVVPAFFLKEFKSRNPDCTFIFYTWDAFANHNHALSILKFFDRKFTFDTKDSIKYSIGFRPLFFIDEYKNILSQKTAKRYDTLFIGTAHSDRYIISDTISEWCKKNSFKSYSFYYMHSLFVYVYKRLFEKGFEKVKLSKLSFKSASLDRIMNLYAESTIIVDIQHPNQSGLTMRTFEAIGAKKKLITTNQEILRYSFYNDNNILVIDRNNIILKKDFFKNDVEEISIEHYNLMSIDGWITEIFFDSTNNFWIKKNSSNE